MDIKAVLKNTTREFKIRLTDNQLLQFEQYYNLLVEWNEKMNLTAITDVTGVAVKHFADSLSLLNYAEIPLGASVIDVGTGAGFPGVALKIARPDIRLTLLDSLNKRLNFLQEVLTVLGLDAELVHSRAEDGACRLKYRERFDFAVSRAVARLNVLAEYCIPYVKTGGKFIAMKGPNADEEIKNAVSAVNQLGGKILSTERFELPADGGERAIVFIDKIKNTPNQFPRKSSRIKTNPL